MSMKLASNVYCSIQRIRNKAYDFGIFPTKTVSHARLISVGNFQTGGTGKTPIGIYLAKTLKAIGLKPGLIFRGYRGKLERTNRQICKGSGPLYSPEHCGDEPYLAASLLPDVSIFVGADRYKSCQLALDDRCDVIVLDDAFQHRSLSRDLDIVVVLPSDYAPSTDFLPNGPLRERAADCKRAFLPVGYLSDWIETRRRPEVLFEQRPIGYFDGNGQQIPDSKLQGMRVILFSGIARPDRFRRTADGLNLNIVAERRYPDHHRYNRQDLDRLEKLMHAHSAKTLLTTEKDMVKLTRFRPTISLFAIRLGIELVRGSNLFNTELGCLFPETNILAKLVP